METYLTVWVVEHVVGKLTVEQGRWHFTYSAGWLEAKTSYALSPCLKLQETPFIDNADDKRGTSQKGITIRA